MSEVTMPQLGESVTEGTITRWFKQPGDEIAEDELLLEVSTDKVDTEVPSPVAGTLQELRVEEGDTVDVGTVIAVIGEGAAASGESADSQPAAGATAGDGTADASSEGPTVDASPTPPPAQPAAAPSQPSEPAAANDAAQPEAAAQAGDAPQTPGAPSGQPTAEASGPPERQAEAPSAESAQPSAPGQGAPSGAAGANAGTLLSPQVRRLLADANLAASEVIGTGVGGRITRQDALGAIEAAKRTGAAGAAPVGSGPSPGVAPAPARPQAAPAAQPSPPAAQPAPVAPRPSPAAPQPSPAAPQPAAAPSGSSVPTPAPVALGAGDTEVPFSNIRRRTGEHMVASKATSPHVITAVEVDYEAVEAARQQFGAEYRASEGHSLTYLPFIARAAVDAISDFPFINASVDGDSLVVHRDVNLSVAVDLNFEGLLAPVVRQASDKRLHAIARDIAEVAQRARAKQLSPDDLVGGTFTLSNSGSFGALFVAPVINQPQVAILSTDGISRRPVAVSDGRGHESIAIHSVGNLTMSWDHRAFDGAYAAAFLARMKEILQTRDWAAEL